MSIQENAEYMSKLEASKKYIMERVQNIPSTAIVLGSGLGYLANQIENPQIMPYGEIPNFPVSGVEGHKGELVFGLLDGVPVVVVNGRVHYYEGWSMRDVTYYVRVFSLLGIKNLLLTNAAGGINPNFNVGDLMIISDHLSFFCPDPLIGPNLDKFGTRFPGMGQVYDENFCKILSEVMEDKFGYSKSGVYAYMTGPKYETPAEIRALKNFGADAVGMSTVPEAIVARHCGMNVAGISCITNMAAGIQKTELNHEEVKIAGEKVSEQFGSVVKQLVKRIQ